jgi:hypothetical protein
MRTEVITATSTLYLKLGTQLTFVSCRVRCLFPDPVLNILLTEKG